MRLRHGSNLNPPIGNRLAQEKAKKLTGEGFGSDLPSKRNDPPDRNNTGRGNEYEYTTIDDEDDAQSVVSEYDEYWLNPAALDDEPPNVVVPFDVDEDEMFSLQAYMVHGSLGLTQSVLHSHRITIDAGAGPNLIRYDFILREWRIRIKKNSADERRLRRKVKISRGSPTHRQNSAPKLPCSYRRHR